MVSIYIYGTAPYPGTGCEIGQFHGDVPGEFKFILPSEIDDVGTQVNDGPFNVSAKSGIIIDQEGRKFPPVKNLLRITHGKPVIGCLIHVPRNDQIPLVAYHFKNIGIKVRSNAVGVGYHQLPFERIAELMIGNIIGL